MLYHNLPRGGDGDDHPRKRKGVSTGSHAQVLIKRGGAIVYRESRTFERKQAAAWLERRETELAKPGAVERVKSPDPTLASVIDRYTEESVKDIGRTKTQVLRAIKRYDIPNRRCSTITSADSIGFANQLVEGHTADRGDYLSHLARCSRLPGQHREISA